MMQIKSLSEKRLLMRVKVNGDDAVMMLDTAASVGILDSRQRKRYKLIEGREWHTPVQGVAGGLQKAYRCDTLIELPNGTKCGQFLLSNISNIVDSIERVTGERILGIMSLSQMTAANMRIDFNDNLIVFE